MPKERVNKLQRILQEKNLSGFLISNYHNILYLTGFKTLSMDEREAWVLVTKRAAYLFTDQRYAKEGLTNEKDIIFKMVTPEKRFIKHLQEIVSEEKINQLGFEADDLKVNELQKIEENLLNTKLIAIEKLIIKIREIKDDEEISNLRNASKISDQCLGEVIKTIKLGISEKEISYKIELWLKERGYDLAFYPIVAINKNSSVPHYNTMNGNNQKIKNNSIILIDFGAKFKDYHSDMTRMIFFGKPDEQIVNVYETLLTAQEKTIQQLKIDNNPVSIDQFCRQQLTSRKSLITSNYSYPHSTGHGVGLQIHEYPKISFVSTDVLSTNQVITIEPGVYFNNEWGMRIEDTILIGANKVEILTNFSKKILIIND